MLILSMYYLYILRTMRALIINFKRAWKYFKHGWKSEDIDYGYFLYDLEFKMKRLAKEMLEYNGITNNELTHHIKTRISRMATIQELIKRLKEEYYLKDMNSGTSEEDSRKMLAKDKKASEILFKLIDHEFRYWWT